MERIEKCKIVSQKNNFYKKFVFLKFRKIILDIAPKVAIKEFLIASTMLELENNKNNSCRDTIGLNKKE